MEEKILQIMFNHSRPNSTIGGRQYITENQYPFTAREVTTHVFEFIEWLHDNTDDTRMVTSKKAYKKWWCTPLRGWFTVEQLYEYWLTVK